MTNSRFCGGFMLMNPYKYSLDKMWKYQRRKKVLEGMKKGKKKIVKFEEMFRKFNFSFLTFLYSQNIYSLTEKAVKIRNQLMKKNSNWKEQRKYNVSTGN